jgi:hypothetical protein
MEIEKVDCQFNAKRPYLKCQVANCKEKATHRCEQSGMRYCAKHMHNHSAGGGCDKHTHKKLKYVQNKSK